MLLQPKMNDESKDGKKKKVKDSETTYFVHTYY